MTPQSLLNRKIDWLVNSADSYYKPMLGKNHNIESILLDIEVGLLSPYFTDNDDLSLEEEIELMDLKTVLEITTLLESNFNMGDFKS